MKNNNQKYQKTFYIVRPEKRSEVMKVYRDFITDNFLMHTFCDGRYVKVDYTRYDGADDDYRWLADIKPTNLQEITKIVDEVHEDTGRIYQPTFVLSSPYGGDYDDPFAKTAKRLFTEKNGFDVWNEIWMGQGLLGKDGNANFTFGETAKRNAGEFVIERAKIRDVNDFARVYDRSINGADSVYASDIETLNYAKKILTTDSKEVDVATFLARHVKTGKVAGFLLGGTDGEHAYINDIGTDPDFRKMGVCSLLVQHFNTYAKQMGAKDVFLDTMDGHPVNVPLYSKLGFRKQFLTVQGWHAEPEDENESDHLTEFKAPAGLLPKQPTEPELTRWLNVDSYSSRVV